MKNKHGKMKKIILIILIFVFGIIVGYFLKPEPKIYYWKEIKEPNSATSTFKLILVE